MQRDPATSPARHPLAHVLLGICLLLVSISGNARIIYSISFDGLLHNDGLGSWGGDLNVGADQMVNLTLEFSFSEYPFLTETGFTHHEGQASFGLLGLQLFDNTHGLASDYLTASGGYSTIAYSHRFDEALDWFTLSAIEYPVGGVLHPIFPANFLQLGDVGDRFPYGAAFDAAVNASSIYLLAVAGINLSLDPGSALYNHVNQLVGTLEPLQPGEFAFASRLIPVSSSASLLALGVACLLSRRLIGRTRY